VSAVARAAARALPSPGLRRPRERQRGQSAVEFLLVLHIVLLIALAVGDFGRIYASGVAVEDAAREAADYTAFDDLSASHFTYDAVTDTVDANDTTRLEALRRACAAVSSLPGYQPTIEATCTDSTSRCTTAAGSFCQLVIEDHRTSAPFVGTCGIDPTQADDTCGWVVHVTVNWTFQTILNVAPLPTSVNLTRDSRFAISALPSGASGP
jgi:Flp pilus assembly protein TadG